MKIIHESSNYHSDQNLLSPPLFFQGSFSKLDTLKMLFPFLFFLIVFIIISFLSLPLVHQESFFYPFAPGSDKTTKTFDFVFKRFSFYHRFLQLDCAFVRHHEGPLPMRKMINHVTENIFLGKPPNIFQSNQTDLEYDQDIIFAKDDYQSNIHSLFLDERFAYSLINLTLIYETNFSDIAGFNFKFSQGNFNVQFLLSESKRFLFYVNLFLVYLCLRNSSIRKTTFFKLILILEISSCLSLNPLYNTFRYPFLKFPIPFFICVFFFIFRIFSIYVLEATLASGISQIRSYTKSMKIFIAFYSFFELKEIYDRYLFIYHPHEVNKFTIFNCFMICLHLIYFIMGYRLCHNFITNQKSASSFHITWSFYITLIIYFVSLLTSFFVNVVFAIFLTRPIIDSISVVMIYQFTMHISIFVYHQIIQRYAIEMDNYFLKSDITLEEGDSFLNSNNESSEN